MKRTIIKIIQVLFVIILLVFAVNALSWPSAQQEQPAVPETAAQPEDKGNPDSNLIGGDLTSEMLKEQVLNEILSYHPGTAGSSLQAASAAANVLSFASEHHVHLLDLDTMKKLLTEAFSSLDSDDQSYFPENLEGVAYLINQALEDYSSVEGQFADAGADTAMEAVRLNPDAAADWHFLEEILLAM